MPIMMLFCILGLPLYQILYAMIYQQEGYLTREAWYPFFKGVLLFFPVYLIRLLFQKVTLEGFSFFPVYLEQISNGFLPFLLLSLAAYFLFFRPSFTSAEGKIAYEMEAFLAGLYSVDNIFILANNVGSFDLYNLIFLPILRINLILLVSLLLARALTSLGLYRKLLYFLMLVPIVLLLALVGTFYAINMWVVALLLLVLFTVASHLLYQRLHS